VPLSRPRLTPWARYLASSRKSIYPSVAHRVGLSIATLVRDGRHHHDRHCGGRRCGAAARCVRGRRGSRALAALEEAWADGGYHAFGVDDELWSAISSAGEVLTASTPDELDRKIRAHWQAMQ
jgi:hypothetical protein